MSVSIRLPNDVPDGTPMAVSLKRTTELNTGSWRTFRPEYVTRPSPCNLDCPAGTDVRTFLTFAGRGDAVGAWRTIMAHNPLPATCGRVCYHPCETACNRAGLDERLAVHAVERAVAAEAWRAQAEQDVIDALPYRDGGRIAIVGSGPAGLSCAYHLARHGHSAMVFEAAAEPGGMLRYGIPEYRLPRQVLADEIGLLRRMGVDFRMGARLGGSLGWDRLREFDAVFVGVGTQRSKGAGVPGEQLEGVRPGARFPARCQRGAGGRHQRPRRRHRRRQHRDRRRTRGPAQRGPGHNRLPPDARGDARAPRRGRTGRGRGGAVHLPGGARAVPGLAQDAHERVRPAHASGARPTRAVAVAPSPSPARP
jgi:hypothetical protein